LSAPLHQNSLRAYLLALGARGFTARGGSRGRGQEGGGEYRITLLALHYATQHLPEAVKTQQVLDTVRYRQVVEETGELLPGVEVVPASEAFRVSFGSGATRCMTTHCTGRSPNVAEKQED
jgi:hypothetical protein